MNRTYEFRECVAALDARVHALSRQGGGAIDEANALAMQSLALVFRIAARRQENGRTLWRVTRVPNDERTPKEPRVRISQPSTVDPV